MSVYLFLGLLLDWILHFDVDVDLIGLVVLLLDRLSFDVLCEAAGWLGEVAHVLI